MGHSLAALSVVIPVLDEGPRVSACLDRLRPLRARGMEVIVCDGGSSDDSVQRASQAGVRVVSSARARARQMNAGAAVARGVLVAFLHADTRVPVEAWDRLSEAAVRDTPVWGRFDVRLSGPGVAFRVIETMMNLRSRLTGIATGDQLMFVTASLFREVGGFPEIDLMEDIALSSILRRRQRPLCLRQRVETSSRKWREEGLVSTVVLMWRLRLAYALGADPGHLAAVYYGSRAKSKA